MKFKFDENLPEDVGALLRREGHDAHSVNDEDLRGAADPSIAKVCQEEQRILITLDLDFAPIRNYPPNDYHGIIVLRLASQDKETVLAIIPRILALLRTEPIGTTSLDCGRSPNPNQRGYVIHRHTKTPRTGVSESDGHKGGMRGRFRYDRERFVAEFPRIPSCHRSTKSW